MSMTAVTVECDEKSVADKAATGALSPAAQSEVEPCRLLLGPLRLSLRAGFLEEREKGRIPSYFTSTIQETRVTLPALIGPTRQIGSSVSKVTKVQSIFISSVIRGQGKCDCSPNSRCFFNYFFVAG